MNRIKCLDCENTIEKEGQLLNRCDECLFTFIVNSKD